MSYYKVKTISHGKMEWVNGIIIACEVIEKKGYRLGYRTFNRIQSAASTKEIPFTQKRIVKPKLAIMVEPPMAPRKKPMEIMDWL